MSSSDTVIFCTATNRIIDFVSHHGDTSTALTRLTPEYGDKLIPLDLNEAHARYEESFRRPPVEIDEQKYWDMLCILPPVGFRTTGNDESFKLSERTAGNITSIYARLGERCFEMSDSIFMKHADIIAAVRASEAYLSAHPRNESAGER